MTAGYVPFLDALRDSIDSWAPVASGRYGLLGAVPGSLYRLHLPSAILRYKLWDIGAIVRDTVTLGLTVLGWCGRAFRSQT